MNTKGKKKACRKLKKSLERKGKERKGKERKGKERKGGDSELNLNEQQHTLNVSRHCEASCSFSSEASECSSISDFESDSSDAGLSLTRCGVSQFECFTHMESVAECNLLTQECVKGLLLPSSPGPSKIRSTLNTQAHEVYELWTEMIAEVRTQWETECRAKLMSEEVDIEASTAGSSTKIIIEALSPDTENSNASNGVRPDVFGTTGGVVGPHSQVRLGKQLLWLLIRP
eukprot:5892008-Amphidinium_carterae.3